VPIPTVFLDSSGVFVFPNGRASARHSAPRRDVPAAALAAAEPRAKKIPRPGEPFRPQTTNSGGWDLLNLVLTEAGVELSTATLTRSAELHLYHQASNLWRPSQTMSGRRWRRACPGAIGSSSCSERPTAKLRHLFERVRLIYAVDALFDSCDEGVEKPDPRSSTCARATGSSAGHHDPRRRPVSR